MRKTVISLGTAVWAVVLLAWALWLLYLLVSEELFLYVHPRMEIFVWFATVGFLILSVVTVRSALRGDGRHKPRAGYAVFLAPLVLAVSLGPHTLGAGAAEKRLLRIRGSGTNQPAGSTSKGRTLEAILASTPPESVLFFEDHFHSALAADMAASPDRYEGRRLSLVGFVHRVPGLTSDRVFITRMLITCCVADAEPFGVLASWQGAPQFQSGQWVRVTGVAKRTIYQDPYTGKKSFLAMIQAEEMVPVEQPATPYLYPSQF